MGNSQSMDKVQHVVKEGINIYKKVKAEQEQQQHNGSNNNNHYNQDSNDYNHHSGGGSSYHPSADNDDDEEYAQLRAQAHEEAQKRNDCYARSQEAYKNGDGAEAKELSNQGHHHDNLMKQYNQRAADHIFSVKNQGRPLNEIDLHGLYVKEASAKVEEAVRRCQANGERDLVIIVGKGLHSPNQIAKLKPAIIELVKKYEVTCQPNIPNPGCLYIEFGKGTGDLSWLDRFTERMSNNDQCLIM
ncbi:hypothetical protein V8B55DRAFT_1516580 [Mucor lusitanicus]|uniref:Smr domain-containing protein n=2 Tax=Mucor circinelloides f. lusitanicus TaxID=29924 RepID=A0A8H4B9C9_MUCCL|nr:hypothetical protein FB192DRAFT_1399651 [Mucor lusitanicus]